MFNFKPASTPLLTGLKLRKGKSENLVDSTYFKSLIGSLRYLTATRPDILYGVSLLSRYMETPTQDHLQAGKRILRYIRGTLSHGIFYSFSNDATLVGYQDVIGMEMLMREKVLLDIFILKNLYLRGLQRNKK